MYITNDKINIEHLKVFKKSIAVTMKNIKLYKITKYDEIDELKFMKDTDG